MRHGTDVLQLRGSQGFIVCDTVCFLEQLVVFNTGLLFKLYVLKT